MFKLLKLKRLAKWLFRLFSRKALVRHFQQREGLLIVNIFAKFCHEVSLRALLADGGQEERVRGAESERHVGVEPEEPRQSATAERGYC